MQINPVAALPIAKKFFREPPSCLSKMFSCFGAQEAVVSAEEQQANDALVQHIQRKVAVDSVSAVSFPRFIAELQESKGDLTLWKERGFQEILCLTDEQCHTISGFVQHRNPGLLRPFYTASASAFLKAVGYGFAQRHLWRSDRLWQMRLWKSFSLDERTSLAIRLDDAKTLQKLMRNPRFIWGTYHNTIRREFQGRFVPVREIISISHNMNILHLAAYYNRPKVLERLLNPDYYNVYLTPQELQRKCSFSRNNHSDSYTPAQLATVFQHREALQVFLRYGFYDQRDFDVAVRYGYAKLIDFINSSAAATFSIGFEACFYPGVKYVHVPRSSAQIYLGKRNKDTPHVRQERYTNMMRFLKRILYQETVLNGVVRVGNEILGVSKTPFWVFSMLSYYLREVKTGKHEALFLLAGHPRNSFVGPELVFGDLNGRLTIQPGNHVVEALDGLHPASGSTDVADFLRMPNTGAHRGAFLARGLQLAVKYQCPIAATYFLEQGAVWDKDCDENKALVLNAIQLANCDVLAVLSLYGIAEKQTVIDSFREAFVGEEVPNFQQKIQELDTAIEAVIEERERIWSPVPHLILGMQASWKPGQPVKHALDRSVGRFAANETFDRNIFGLIQDFTNGVGPRRIR